MSPDFALRDTLSLENDGHLDVYFVGTGSAFAKTLNQNNIIITKGSDHVLVDCGNKCTQALHEIGVGVPQIENFLITHSHADHIGGLEEVMMFGRYLLQRKPNIIVCPEYEAILWEQSLKGGAGPSEKGDGSGLHFRDFWNVTEPTRMAEYERETFEVDLGSINLKMPRTMHYPDDAASWQDSWWSCGVIIDERILYTSDTRFDEDLITLYDGAYDFEAIFHDCQLFTGGVHASLEELSGLPERIKAKTILMHYGDNWADFRQEAKDAGFHSFAEQGRTYRFKCTT